MAAELEQIAKDLEAIKFSRGAGVVRIITSLLTETKAIPPSIKKLTEFNKEWERQVALLIASEFNLEVNGGGRDYVESLPVFTSKPEEIFGEPLRPLIVDPRIPLKKQCKLLGIRYHLDGQEVGEWPQEGDTPHKPYTTWVSATGFKTAKEARRAMSKGRPANVFDGLALFIANGPEWGEVLVMPGTQLGHPDSPYTVALRIDREGKPALVPHKISNKNPNITVLGCWGPQV